MTTTDVDYQLQSRPETTVTVPASCAAAASGLVAYVLTSTVADLDQAIAAHPSLTNASIVSRVIALRTAKLQSRDPSRIQDELYLRVCLYELQKTPRPYRTAASLALTKTLATLVDSLDMVFK